MPAFDYYCKTCRIQFEEILIQPTDVKKFAQQHPCPKCRKTATRVPISKVNFSFKAPAGPTQGSGVHGQSGSHDLDYPSLDKAVGRSADHKWQAYGARKKARDEVRRRAGTNYIMSDGEKNTPLTSDQLKIREKAVRTFKAAKKQHESGGSK